MPCTASESVTHFLMAGLDTPSLSPMVLIASYIRRMNPSRVESSPASSISAGMTCGDVQQCVKFVVVSLQALCSIASRTTDGDHSFESWFVTLRSSSCCRLLVTLGSGSIRRLGLGRFGSSRSSSWRHDEVERRWNWNGKNTKQGERQRGNVDQLPGKTPLTIEHFQLYHSRLC